jgi:biotin transport system substrate-specific component
MREHRKVATLVVCGMMAALVSILAWVSVPLPISPVPVTLQTLGVLLAGGLLGRLYGPVSVAVYVFVGLVGVPVFAGGASGIGELVGPRGGYLIGFILAAFIMGLTADRVCSRGLEGGRALLLLAAGGTAATLLIYCAGVPWLALVTGMGLSRGLIVGAALFLPGDILKLAVAVPLIRAVDLALVRAGLR